MATLRAGQYGGADRPQPLAVGANRPRQFYLAGQQAGPFRRLPLEDRYRPEDWLASTVSLFSEPGAGQSRLPDGRLLVDAVGADPEGWLGPSHVQAWGDDPGLLVKLLDAGQRLPVHFHPSRAFARRHLGCAHGKTEAWVVVGTSGHDPRVWLGFRHDVDGATLDRWVGEQDREALLGSLHTFPVAAGDTVLVPAGVPHAVGAGVFFVELQEPTDFSINLEWAGFDLPPGDQGQLGLDPATALSALRRQALPGEEVEHLRSGRGGGRLLPAEADPYFRAERVDVAGGTTLAPGFAVLIGLSGSGELVAGDGTPLEVSAGAVVVSPWAAGPVTARSRSGLRLLSCRPPDPTAEADSRAW